ncbi:MAG: ATP-binding cassette domain-containing protein [Gemmatimonadaceae bacterium]|nr:ATP-binding cassette domain-containing protein [Gemmatimonadaceae bacterium]
MSAVLEVRDLAVSRGEQQVLKGLDLTVDAGEIWALMGVSGAGKTTVLRAIAALQPFSAGSIAVGTVTLKPGALLPESRLRALRGKVGMVFQAHALFEHLSVLDNVTLSPIHALGVTRERAESVARELLESLGVLARVDALPRQLSGGEAQRVAIARALALDPLLLLMDEPTSALDPARRGALGDTLRALARSGRGLLIATHDVEFAEAHADRVAVLSHGVLVEHGAARDVLQRPQHAATKELLVSPDA